MLLRLLCLCVLGVSGCFGPLLPAKSIDDFHERRQLLQDDDAEAHYRLAQWCRANGYMPQYRELLEQTIAINPEHPEARRQLRYRKIGGAWYTGDELQRKLGNVLHEGK
jgi:ABC-type nitrate/sulfonate/bicarbonate transport system substrate-binding protein